MLDLYCNRLTKSAAESPPKWQEQYLVSGFTEEDKTPVDTFRTAKLPYQIFSENSTLKRQWRG